jgi:hypothetical protein
MAAIDALQDITRRHEGICGINLRSKEAATVILVTAIPVDLRGNYSDVLFETSLRVDLVFRLREKELSGLILCQKLGTAF